MRTTAINIFWSRYLSNHVIIQIGKPNKCVNKKGMVKMTKLKKM